MVNAKVDDRVDADEGLVLRAGIGPTVAVDHVGSIHRTRGI